MSSNLNQPELPYNGTSGYSGSETSKARAINSDRSGKTALRQAQALNLLAQRKFHGMTVRELSELTGLHHGSASGVLSVLHKVGRIARLKESRNGRKVYVDLRCINQRRIERQGRNKSCPHCGGNL